MERRDEGERLQALVDVNHGLVLKLRLLQAENALLRHKLTMYQRHHERMIHFRAEGPFSVN